MAKLTPWQKIMRAYQRGTGLTLTRDEIGMLGQDGAIETRSGLDWEEQGAGSMEASIERPTPSGEQGIFFKPCRQCGSMAKIHPQDQGLCVFCSSDQQREDRASR